MKLLIAGTLALVATARPAAACGVVNFGDYLAAVAKAFETEVEPVHTPMLEVSSGATTEGQMVAAAIGYGWGERETGGIFPGTSLQRVMFGVRTDGHDTAISTTYGWYTNGFGFAALDVGLESQVSGTRGLGPLARVTFGSKGLGVRLSGGAAFGDNTARVTGSAELVVEVMELGGRL